LAAAGVFSGNTDLQVVAFLVGEQPLQRKAFWLYWHAP